MKKMKEKYIVFDVMGVIFTVGDDTNDLLVPFIMAKNSNIDKDTINELYLKASLGQISSEEFWHQTQICSNGKEAEVEKEYLDSCLTIDPHFIEVARKLKEKYSLAILSNDVSEWSKYLRKKYDIDSYVDNSVISGDVNYRKPSSDIYYELIKKLNVNPANCVFIDDREKSLLPAMKMGMKVIKFLREDDKCSIDDIPAIKDFYELEDVVETLI